MAEALTTPVERYPRAPLIRRYVALLIDGIVPAPLLIPGFLLIGGGAATGDSALYALGVVLVLLAAAVAVWYGFTHDGRPGGAGIGKRMMGLMVVHLPSGTPCTRSQSALRVLVTLLINIVPFVGWIVEPVVALIADDGRRLADKAAETQVIEAAHYRAIAGDQAEELPEPAPAFTHATATVPPAGSAPVHSALLDATDPLPSSRVLSSTRRESSEQLGGKRRSAQLHQPSGWLSSRQVALGGGVALAALTAGVGVSRGWFSRQTAAATTPAVSLAAGGEPSNVPAEEGASTPVAERSTTEATAGGMEANVPPPADTDSVSLANARYGGFWLAGVHQLRNGETQPSPGSGFAAMTAYAAGDLDGDPVPDAVAVLNVSGGGSGIFVHLVAVRGTSRGTRWGGVAEIGDRVIVDSVAIRGRRVFVWGLTHGEDDPSCCPADISVIEYDFANGDLSKRLHRILGRDTLR